MEAHWIIWKRQRRFKALHKIWPLVPEKEELDSVISVGLAACKLRGLSHLPVQTRRQSNKDQLLLATLYPTPLQRQRCRLRGGPWLCETSYICTCSRSAGFLSMW